MDTNICVYIYIYIYTHTHIYTYIYIYNQLTLHLKLILCRSTRLQSNFKKLKKNKSPLSKSFLLPAIFLYKKNFYKGKCMNYLLTYLHMCFLCFFTATYTPLRREDLVLFLPCIHNRDLLNAIL